MKESSWQKTRKLFPTIWAKVRDNSACRISKGGRRWVLSHPKRLTLPVTVISASNFSSCLS